MTDRNSKAVPAARTVQTNRGLFDFGYIMENAIWDVNEKFET